MTKVTNGLGRHGVGVQTGGTLRPGGRDVALQGARCVMCRRAAAHGTAWCQGHAPPDLRAAWAETRAAKLARQTAKRGGSPPPTPSQAGQTPGVHGRRIALEGVGLAQAWAGKVRVTWRRRLAPLAPADT